MGGDTKGFLGHKPLLNDGEETRVAVGGEEESECILIARAVIGEEGGLGRKIERFVGEAAGVTAGVSRRIERFVGEPAGVTVGVAKVRVTTSTTVVVVVVVTSVISSPGWLGCSAVGSVSGSCRGMKSDRQGPCDSTSASLVPTTTTSPSSLPLPIPHQDPPASLEHVWYVLLSSAIVLRRGRFRCDWALAMNMRIRDFRTPHPLTCEVNAS